MVGVLAILFGFYALGVGLGVANLAGADAVLAGWIRAVADLGSGPDLGAANAGGGAGPEYRAEQVVLEAGGEDVGRAVCEGVDDGDDPAG